MNVTVFASATLLALGAGAWLTQDEPAIPRPKPLLPGDMEEGMRRWMEVCQTSDEHKALGWLLGEWEVTQRMRMGGPGSEPVESKGTAEFHWLAQDKWLEASTSGSFVGMPVTGRWLLGYDNFKERYVMCMVDSIQTAMNTAQGHVDKDGAHLILWGTIDEPMTPEQDKQVKYVFRNWGADTWTFEIHDMMIGESDTKVLEFEHRRRK
jgi:hypothetical protein